MVYRPTLFAAVLLVIVATALIAGRKPERHVAVALLAGYVASLLVQPAVPHRYFTVAWGLFAVDLALAITLAILAAVWRRGWIAWLSAMQFVTVAGHLAKGIIGDLPRFAYQFLVFAWSYPIVALLAVVTITGIVRRSFASDR